MGIEYNKRPVGQAGGVALPVNTVTLSSAAASLAVGINAVTYDSSGVASDMLLPAIKTVGEVVSVALFNGTTSVEANINTASTAVTLFGSSFNTATANSTAGSLLYGIEFTSVSTSQWAVTSISSTADWVFAATTGSTGQ
jgi:hypothetical protein